MNESASSFPNDKTCKTFKRRSGRRSAASVVVAVVVLRPFEVDAVAARRREKSCSQRVCSVRAAERRLEARAAMPDLLSLDINQSKGASVSLCEIDHPEKKKKKKVRKTRAR